MQPVFSWQKKALPAASLPEWRAGLGTSETVAVVAGAFDLLQPGNLAAVRAARQRAARVCVILEPDDAARAHAGEGRPQNPLGIRAEMAACLRGVDAVAALSGADAPALLRGLRPFTWMRCAGRGETDTLSAALAAAANAVADLPALPGCFTGDIHEAIRAGRTPIRAARLAVGPASAEDPAPPHRGAELVTVNGCFDILHVGHLRFLSEARALGGRLAVLINSDASVQRFKGASRPVFPQEFRRTALLALEPVDEVHVFDEDNPLALIARLRPRVHAKGGTFIPERAQAEKTLVESWGGRAAFCPLTDGFSTSDYIRRVLGG